MDYQGNSVGKIVFEARKNAGFKTQQELAKRLKVDAVYVCNIEKDRHLPGVELGAKIAKVLKLDVREFLFLLLRSKHPSLATIFKT